MLENKAIIVMFNDNNTVKLRVEFVIFAVTLFIHSFFTLPYICYQVKQLKET